MEPWAAWVDGCARDRWVSRSMRWRLAVFVCLAAALLPLSRAEAHEGWGIVVDATGRIYVGDIPANVVWRISRTGDVERIAVGKHSHALVLTSTGDIYGTNPHLTLPIRSVWRLSPSGQLTDIIPPTDGFPLGLQSFIIDDAGNIYSVNARNAQTSELLLLKRTPTGEVSTLAGSMVGHADGTGARARFTGIDGMAWGPDGGLYVTDGPYVRRISLDGTVTTLGGGALTTRALDEDLLGIAVAANGDVFVADYTNRRILKLAGGSAVSTHARSGLAWAPTGVTVASDGIYVLEHLRLPLAILGDLAIGPYLRVRHISADGTATVLARMWGRHTLTAASVLALLLLVIVGARRMAARRRPLLSASARTRSS